MNVRAFGSRTSAQKSLFSCTPSDGVKVFGAGTSAQISARTSAGYPAPKLLGERQSIALKHPLVFALLTPETHSYEMAQMLQKPVFALLGCQRMSVNTLLCDTLGLVFSVCLGCFSVPERCKLNQRSCNLHHRTEPDVSKSANDFRTPSPPLPQSLAMNEFCFTPCGICGD